MMKKIYSILSFILLVITSNAQTQNDSIYFWKSEQLILKQSIKPTDLDSISFSVPEIKTPELPEVPELVVALDDFMSLYDIFSLPGSNGPATSYIPGDDAGESPFLRSLINLQDFTADGMKNRWGDNGLDQLTTTSNWDENNKFFRYHYNRLNYAIVRSNAFIKLLKSSNENDKAVLISEARFLRALAYFYLIDSFGSVPLITELTGTAYPTKASRIELFQFVTSELIDICDANLTSSTNNLLPFTNTYGRTNRTAARMLLAKLYLNAEVYTGENNYDQAYKYSKLVIDEGGYKLANNFTSLFSRDNDVTDAKNEIIYPIIADPLTSQSYGNTTYLINGSLSSATMDPTVFGNPGGDSNAWGGHRATKAWYGLFANSAQGLAEATDDRARLFFTNYTSTDPSKIHNFEMNDYKKWVDGFPSIKFINTNFSGIPESPVLFVGTDFPLYRLGDAYLMFAESILRGGGGTTAIALIYVNAIRTRSKAKPITSGELTLDFILDERARELNFEGHRRTDLIRFGKFTGGSYLWPWKGGVKDGTSIPDYYKLFPIPYRAIQANPNLSQNTDYPPKVIPKTFDVIYFWKAGKLILQRSIKTADLDSITFVKPNPSRLLAFAKNLSSAESAPKMAPKSLFSADYEGYMYLEVGDYKIYQQDSFGSFASPKIYGGGSGGVLNEGSNAPSINIVTAGHYLVKANLTEGNLTYSIKYIKAFGIFGLAVRSNPGSLNMVPMTAEGTSNIWKITIDLFKGRVFKFKSSDWTVALVGIPPSVPSTSSLAISTLGGSGTPITLGVESSLFDFGTNLQVPGNNDGTKQKYDVVIDVSKPRNYSFSLIQNPN